MSTADNYYTRYSKASGGVCTSKPPTDAKVSQWLLCLNLMFTKFSLRMTNVVRAVLMISSEILGHCE